MCNYIAAAGNNILKIWNLDTYEVLYTFKADWEISTLSTATNCYTLAFAEIMVYNIKYLDISSNSLILKF